MDYISWFFPETFIYLVAEELFLLLMFNEAGDEVYDRFLFLDSSLFDPDPDCSCITLFTDML